MSIFKKYKIELLNYFLIFIGSFFLAFGIVGFLSPNKIATGGTAGLAIIFYHITGLSIGTLMILINIPLLIICYKFLGRKFVVRTIITILLISFLVDFIAIYLYFSLSSNLLLATVYGGLSIGIGLGLIFKGESSAGGATILAKIIAMKTSYKPGYLILILDAIVVIATGLLFKNIELALWSLIGIYVTSKLIDLVLTGKQYEKIVHITSQNIQLLADKIKEDLHLTGTLLKGNDISSNKNKDVLLLIVEANQINNLKRLIQKYDTDAYMVIMEATELLGPSRKIGF
jgi:uncharacterized membrane-anchored protein YitT (DUF2179 family)